MIQSVSSTVASVLAATPAPVPAAANASAQGIVRDSATISPEGRALLAAEQSEAQT